LVGYLEQDIAGGSRILLVGGSLLCARYSGDTPRFGAAAAASRRNRFAVSSSVIRPRSQRDKKVSTAKAPPEREITHRSD